MKAMCLVWWWWWWGTKSDVSGLVQGELWGDPTLLPLFAA